MKKFFALRVLPVLAAGLLVSCLAAMPASAAPASSVAGAARTAKAGSTDWGKLLMGERLNRGDRLVRYADGQLKYYLSMQYDGNLVLYRGWDGLPCWASNSSSGDYVIFQYDANFVLYDTAGRPIWASNTSNGSPDRRWTVDINDSGVVYVGYHPLNPGGC